MRLYIYKIVYFGRPGEPPVYGGVNFKGSGFDSHQQFSFDSLHVYMFLKPDVTTRLPRTSMSAVVLVIGDHGSKASCPGYPTTKDRP